MSGWVRDRWMSCREIVPNPGTACNESNYLLDRVVSDLYHDGWWRRRESQDGVVGRPAGPYHRPSDKADFIAQFEIVAATEEIG